jgi:N-acetylglucosamine malate deacetylase 1
MTGSNLSSNLSNLSNPSWKILRQWRQTGRLITWRTIARFKAIRVQNWLDQIAQEKIPKFMVNSKRALIFAPHQDDETLGCGGLIALKGRQNVPVEVIFLTDGSQSHTAHVHPLHVLRRKQEAEMALAILGVSSAQTHFLDFNDGGLTHFSDEQRRHAVERLVKLVQDFAPEEVYVPHRQDRHPDHEATYALAIEALQLAGLGPQVIVWQYPIWHFWDAPPGFTLQQPELSGLHRLSITTVREQKQRAIAVYTSQPGVLPPGFLEQFIGDFELFFKQSG